MSHNLNIKSGKASMFYYGETPWHGLGTPVEKALTSVEALEKAQLDYVVEKYPMFAKMGELYIPTDRYATVRIDENTYLGNVSSVYSVLQNAEAFSTFDEWVGEGEAIFHTAGALGKGERVWILAKLPDFMRIGKDDVVEKYLLLSNGHDGNTSLVVCVTPVRVVCQNTLQVALKGAEQRVAIRHRGDMKIKLDVARKVLNVSNKLYEELNGIFNGMAKVQMPESHAKLYLEELIPNKKDVDNSRLITMKEQILELVTNGAGQGLSAAKGTVWGAYNAVTEYADHIFSDREMDNRERVLSSVWFGSRSELKREAFSLAKRYVEDGGITSDWDVAKHLN